ncbi:MAG: glycoside hydrolase family 16 protein [Treponema sp.]|nr:glycoside hydrolase family 16 protein [Treponema sp.]
MKKLKSKIYTSALVIAGFMFSSCCFIPQEEEVLDKSKMKLVWEENFDSSLNMENWYYYEGTAMKEDTPTVIKGNVITGPIFNREQQNYKKSQVTTCANDDAEDGMVLKITAKKTKGKWNSGKIQTSNKVDMKYGYIEARIKMPVAYDSKNNEIENNGVWPAFWMMPTESVYGTWPRSGEIDIMEYSPSVSGNKAYATLHHAKSKDDATDVYPSLGSKIIDDGEFHTYGVLWTSGTLEAFYDGESLGSIYANQGNNWAMWPYDQEFYVIINLAMGGNLGGAINPKMEKAEYLVDYVRYYK